MQDLIRAEKKCIHVSCEDTSLCLKARTLVLEQRLDRRAVPLSKYTVMRKKYTATPWTMFPVLGVRSK